MSEKKDMPSSEEKDGLNFEDVKNLTIEEAVRKDSEETELLLPQQSS